MFLASVCAAVSAPAFPTWIGVYGTEVRHTDSSNPGTYTILMNQDYWGLHAEIGVQVNGGAWTTYAMAYAGNKDGNSKWTFTPAAAYPAGATVKYYFHGWDDWGGHIWDSNYGQDYGFTVSGGAVNVQRLGDGTWYSETSGYIGNVQWWGKVAAWIDVRVKNIASAKEVGIVWSDNNGQTWRTAQCNFELDLGGGYERWGVDIIPTGTFWWDRGGAHSWESLDGTRVVFGSAGKYIKYAIYYTVNGQTYWDNNGGQDYTLWVVRANY